MRSGYKLSADEIAVALRAVVDLEGVTVQQVDEVHAALDALEQGLDFADALHVAQSGDCEAFVTFDRRLVPRGGALGLATPVQQA